METSTSAASALLDRGASVDALASLDHNTALHCAAACGALALVDLLVAHGADVLVKNREGMTAFDRARALRHGAVAGRLRDEMRNVRMLREEEGGEEDDLALPPEEAPP